MLGADPDTMKIQIQIHIKIQIQIQRQRQEMWENVPLESFLGKPKKFVNSFFQLVLAENCSVTVFP